MMRGLVEAFSFRLGMVYMFVELLTGVRVVS